jgi:hypothetical protein
MRKKVLWGMVNYKCEAYIPTQLKMSYEFNDEKDFDFIIVDNNPIFDEGYWKEIKKVYSNLVVIPHVPINVNRTSGEHGSGLDVILNYARENNYEYLLVNDPDFFWVQKNILKYFLAEFSTRDIVCIGAPYTIPLQHFDYNTPCAFGSIYTMKFLEGIKFSCDKDQHNVVIGGKDVGWEIRQKIALTNAKHLTFIQKDVPASEFVGGSHQTGMNYSWQALLKEYFLWNKRISYHLHRGSFSSHLNNYSKDNWRSDRSIDTEQAPELWTNTRRAYCAKYYEEIKNSKGMM